jgi:hypothetical protein
MSGRNEHVPAFYLQEHTGAKMIETPLIDLLLNGNNATNELHADRQMMSVGNPTSANSILARGRQMSAMRIRSLERSAVTHADRYRNKVI